ncbi:MAG TPA: hypothetical protein VFZ22_08235 [Pyrinomonadaceae bacterium]|nr:hypothetical protein [Pyrinomonadaceae bacterium]
MKLNYSGKKLGGYLLAFFLLFGILTVASSSAQAQYPWGNDRYRRDRDWDYRNRQSGYQAARQQGYSYGLNVGAADAQRGQSYNPQRSRYYRNGSRGWSQQAFRDGFLQGYRDGYQRYAYNRRYGRRW